MKLIDFKICFVDFLYDHRFVFGVELPIMGGRQRLTGEDVRQLVLEQLKAGVEVSPSVFLSVDATHGFTDSTWQDIGDRWSLECQEFRDEWDDEAPLLWLTYGS